MSKQHTPGPWETIYAPGQAGAYYLSAPDGVIGLINVPNQDARLICAAPELLAALKDMLIFYDCIVIDDVAQLSTATVTKKAEDAIKKAEGKL